MTQLSIKKVVLVGLILSVLMICSCTDGILQTVVNISADTDSETLPALSTDDTDSLLLVDSETNQETDITNDSDPQINYYGRFYHTTKARYSWPGVYIDANFKGTEISALFKDKASNWLVYIDGQLTTEIVTDDDTTYKSYQIATELTDEAHTVLMVKKNETAWNTGYFDKFNLGEEGLLLPPDPKPALGIEFFGDSFLLGRGCEYPYQDLQSGDDPVEVDRSYTNAYLSWGAVGARTLDAQYRLNAITSKGWIRNYNGEQADRLFTDHFKLTLASELNAGGWESFPSDNQYDTSLWIPDMVVIDMGINDFLGVSAPLEDADYSSSASQYHLAYHNFLNWVRNQYGNDVPIIMALRASSHINITQALDQMRNIYNEQLAVGHTNVHLWEYPLLKPDNTPFVWPAYQDRPSVAEHKLYADDFVEFVTSNNLLPANSGK